LIISIQFLCLTLLTLVDPIWFSVGPFLGFETSSPREWIIMVYFIGIIIAGIQVLYEKFVVLDGLLGWVQNRCRKWETANIYNDGETDTFHLRTSQIHSNPELTIS